MSKHRCPDDPEEFFRQLYLYFQFRDKRENPKNLPECPICGDLIDVEDDLHLEVRTDRLNSVDRVR